MIIVVTDHGHLFGEHCMIGKPWSDLGDSNMYEELAHIPLLIYHPNGQKGKRVSHLVQPVDLFATVLDGFNIPLPAGRMGRVCFRIFSTLTKARPSARWLSMGATARP